jgi:hypothetical protein
MNTWGMNIFDVLTEIEQFGFKQVLDIPFLNDEGTKQEHMYVYFHYQYGIVLQFDTYSGDHVNGGNYYYQWMAKDGQPCNSYAFSSGGWERKGDVYIWEGHGDCRQGMFESIRELAHEGDFVTPWIRTCRIFVPTLVHYMDHHSIGTWDEGYKLYEKALIEKTPERFRMLPELVQCAIKANMRTPTGEE